MTINDPRDIVINRVWYSAQAETGYADGATMTQLRDWSGNGYHAAAVGTPKWRATGGQGGGPWIDTSTGYFEIPQAAFFSLTAATALIWVKPAPAPENGGHWNFGPASDLNHYPYSDVIYDDFGSSTRRGMANIPSRTWHRYRVATGPGLWTAWGNGTELYTTVSNTVAWTAGVAYLGVSINTGTYRIPGFSMFGLWDHVLTAGQNADLEAWAVANPSGGVPYVAASGPTMRWWDGTAQQPVTLDGWWDGTSIQPATLDGWWDGTAQQGLS